MQHPYGPGLLIPPHGRLARLRWWAERAGRRLLRYALRPFDVVGLNRLRVMRSIDAKDRIGQEVSHYEIIHPACTLDIGRAQDREFLARCSHYSSGVLTLAETFVCEVSPAFLYPALGLVANQHFEVFMDSHLLSHRFETSLAYRRLRPWRFLRRAGPVSSVQRIDAYNFWHWMADCLPQVLTLERYMRGRPLTLLCSDTLGGFQRQTLDLVKPDSMTVEFVPADTWVRAERLILPSYLSGLCNGYLPENYYAEIRCRITRALGLPDVVPPGLRIYLTRAGAKRRRVLNEAAVIELLSTYGFTAVRPEKMTLREQVSMFQRAAVIVGPHGAALGGMVFSTDAKVLVLYPERRPGEYFYTMARRIGLEHYGVVHDGDAAEDEIGDFAANIPALRATLEKMGLEPYSQEKS